MKRLWILLGLLAVAPCGAQEATSKPAEPKAANEAFEKVLDALITALGGAEALGKIENRVAEGKLSIPAQGITGKIKTVGKDPLHSMVSTEIAQLGSEREGINGDVAWHVSLAGPRLKSASEYAQTVRMGHFDYPVQFKKNYAKLYAKIDVEKGVDFKGKKCTKITGTPPAVKTASGSTKTSPVEVVYIDEATNLIHGMEFESTTQLGKLKVAITVSDYREIDGVKVAYKAMQEVVGLGYKVELTTDKVEHNVKLEEGALALPPEIQKMIDKKKESAEG
ncbi:MAG: hypothetical protein AAF488_02170 [Planctomycetota bacterium]